MIDPQLQKPAAEPHARKWPWWQPYLFTSGVLAAFVVLLLFFDFLASIPWAEPILFGLLTLAAVVHAFRKPLRPPSYWSELVLALALGLGCLACLAEQQVLLSVCYGALSLTWLGVALRCATLRRSMLKVRSAERNRALQAFEQQIQQNQPSES